MTLMEKIIQLRPSLTKDDFGPDEDKIAMVTITSESGITQQKLNQHRKN